MFTGVRNYQIIDKSEKDDNGKDTHLIEIGPRFVLVPIRLFNGSMGGATLYQNPAYISPNEERSEFKRAKGYVIALNMHCFRIDFTLTREFISTYSSILF